MSESSTQDLITGALEQLPRQKKAEVFQELAYLLSEFLGNLNDSVLDRDPGHGNDINCYIRLFDSTSDRRRPLQRSLRSASRRLAIAYLHNLRQRCLKSPNDAISSLAGAELGKKPLYTR